MTKIIKAGVVVAGLSAASAFAALPANVSTALTDAAADGITAGGLVLAAIVGIFALKLIRRAL